MLIIFKSHQKTAESVSFGILRRTQKQITIMVPDYSRSDSETDRDRQTDRQTDRAKRDRQTGRQTDRQRQK